MSRIARLGKEKTDWIKSCVTGLIEDLLCQEKNDWVKKRVTGSREALLCQE